MSIKEPIKCLFVKRVELEIVRQAELTVFNMWGLKLEYKIQNTNRIISALFSLLPEDVQMLITFMFSNTHLLFSISLNPQWV